jgi:N-methylhydantoinase A
MTGTRHYKIGIDVGGTFTDFLVINEEGEFDIHKTPSTPEDFSKGLMGGLEEIATKQNMPLKQFLSQVDVIVHGATVTTNAVLTGTTAKTGFITTEGFRDYLTQRRGLKRNAYNPKESPPTPIVPRYLRQVVKERIDCEGKEFIPLKEEDVYSALKVFERENVEAVAVNLIFSFLNPSHEQRVKEIIEKELPGVYVSLASRVLAQVRIYERASTTVFNAAVGPILKRYIESLLRKLRQNGFEGPLLLMQSNGGVILAEVGVDFAVNTLFSGPAGGPRAGLFFAAIHGFKNFITVDMGGTSFDACLVKDEEPEVTTETDIAEYRVAVPSLFIKTIGAGGGSIAWIDPKGMIRVGPKSAGAVPGPACYDMGGEEPAVTDADLVLGYLDPDYFLGGRKKLHLDKAKRAIQKIAQPLQLSVEGTAFGIYKIVNLNMAQGIRMVSIARGRDPREFALIVAGGAGPVHACEIAKELGIPLILVPKQSSIFCAMGMLASNLKHDFVRASYMLLKEGFLDLDKVNALYREMKNEGTALLQKEGIPPDRMKFSYSCDLRYEAQFNEIEIPMPLSDDDTFAMTALPSLLEAFNQKHDAIYGYSMPTSPIELISLRVSAEGTIEKPRLDESAPLGEDASKAQKGWREIYFEEEPLRVPIYDGRMMGYGNKLAGPAIIEEPTTTIFVTPDHNLVCDRYNNYLMYPKERSLEEILSSL